MQLGKLVLPDRAPPPRHVPRRAERSASARARQRSCVAQMPPPRLPEIDYANHWRSALAEAESAIEKLRASERSTHTFSPPKVFIYNLPAELSEGWDPESATVERSLDPPCARSGFGPMRAWQRAKRIAPRQSPGGTVSRASGAASWRSTCATPTTMALHARSSIGCGSRGAIARLTRPRPTFSRANTAASKARQVHHLRVRAH